MGRPKKEPILPHKIDSEEEKKDVRGQLYESEWEVLREKLEERGYTSIAEWIEDEAEKVILDLDLEERLEEVENKIEKEESVLEDLKQKRDDLKEEKREQEEEKAEIVDVLSKALMDGLKYINSSSPSSTDLAKIVNRAFTSKEEIEINSKERINLIDLMRNHLSEFKQMENQKWTRLIAKKFVDERWVNERDTRVRGMKLEDEGGMN